MEERSIEYVHSPLEKRWWALGVVCLACLMIVLDTTIVNVALPSIKADLGFSEGSLVWVVNAYLLAFGGLQLLGGRLGDLFGYRRLFIGGLALFTLASLLCGLAGSQWELVCGRALQGLAAAVVSSVALALTLNLFTEVPERARAMGFLGFVEGGAGSIALLVGGTVTTTFNWHWVFFINIPIGVAVCLIGLVCLPKDEPRSQSGPLDVAGAFAITAALVMALLALANGSGSEGPLEVTLGLGTGAIVLLILFVRVESRVAAPLCPLDLFRRRSFLLANGASVLLAIAMFAWYFMCTLYLQFVLGYNPLQVGLAFLPANLVTAAFALGLSVKVVEWFGIKLPLIAGPLLSAAGLLLFARTPVNGSALTDVLPGMILLAIGSGVTSTPLLLAATEGMPSGESGVVSGVIGTASMLGGAFGLAVLANLAAARTSFVSSLLSAPSSEEALVSGYHLAFLVGAIFAGAAAIAGACLKPAVRAGCREH
jgi:EmrB/QacA subfamily drug resistance transporter